MQDIPLGKKIQQMREGKKFSQEKLGRLINYDRATISNIETGKLECPTDIRWAIKEALGLSDLPITDKERERFKEKLYDLNDLISAHKFDDAEKELDKLSVITRVPIDVELNAFYSLFKARLLLKLNDVESARAILLALESSVDEFDNDFMHLYYYNRGTLSHKYARYREALDFYLKAHELMKGGFKENQWLHYNIAACISGLGHVVNTITFIENCCKFSSDNQIVVTELMIDDLLALSYIKLGNMRIAKKLLKKCLVKAKSNNNERFIGIILVHYGYLYCRKKDWDTAISYLNEAFGYLQKDDLMYLEALYQKIWCLIHLECYSACSNLLSEGKELAKGNEDYSILFESLSHLITLNTKESIEYLETVTVPHLVRFSANVVALDYCKILKKNYEKRKGTLKKLLEIEKTMNSLYRNMLDGSIVE